MKKTLLAITLALMSITVFAAPPSKKNPYADQIETAQSMIKSQLKDPGSAQWKDVEVVIKKSGTKTICGQVNAKNSFGGYVGFKRFSASLDNPFIVAIDIDFATYQQLCMTDAQEAEFIRIKAMMAAKEAAEIKARHEEMRKTRRENIRRECDIKIADVDKLDVSIEEKKVKIDKINEDCAFFIAQSDAQ